MGLIDDVGILAIATRMQRLAEMMRKDGLQIYKDHNIAFEPKWFPVIYTLYHKPLLSVVEIAGEIGYTHPSTISLLKELEKEKLIRSKKDKIDSRKRLLQLTDKGQEMVTQMKPVWNLMIDAITELTNTPTNLLQAIIEVEDKLEEKSMSARAADIRARKIKSE